MEMFKQTGALGKDWSIAVPCSAELPVSYSGRPRAFKKERGLGQIRVESKSMCMFVCVCLCVCMNDEK